MRISRRAAALIGAFAVLTAVTAPARAEVSEITVAQQYGVSFLPLMVMERRGLAERHAEAAGLKGLKVSWVKVAGPSAMNDGLLSGTMHFAAQGAPSMITLWDRTRGNVGIKGVAAMTTYPLYLVSRNPAVKSIRDFGPGDKIAVPSIKISTQAIMIQMAAAAAFGDKEATKLDPLTISLSHPDAVLAMTSGTGGVNAHFTSSPFYEQEMKLPQAHLVTTNYEILGGPATAVVLTASTRFREANPKAYRAFFDGLSEAIAIINADKRAAAQLYLEVAKDTKNSVDDILAIISDKDYAYTLKPQKVFETAAFMAKIGTVKQAPGSVEDLFFPEGSSLKGE
ncbi:ABC transporter substrate-binding protein [Methylobacterium sp. NEAU 140]|uniref:ABC transporter substrate-binding protein n=1 Tax=Methylobacterium sp. NEAU 140 TaxID=3064945 RepID=UPI00273671AD|nr:ABC transporter substrate-binding protein [Methylobacterium sp. NEAU 140]MDP4022854.1 ABC transporter substrate-binding protein [Methylobacterium sp. NEAU 140]